MALAFFYKQNFVDRVDEVMITKNRVKIKEFFTLDGKYLPTGSCTPPINFVLHDDEKLNNFF